MNEQSVQSHQENMTERVNALTIINANEYVLNKIPNDPTAKRLLEIGRQRLAAANKLLGIAGLVLFCLTQTQAVQAQPTLTISVQPLSSPPEIFQVPEVIYDTNGVPVSTNQVTITNQYSEMVGYRIDGWTNSTGAPLSIWNGHLLTNTNDTAAGTSWSTCIDTNGQTYACLVYDGGDFAYQMFGTTIAQVSWNSETGKLYSLDCSADLAHWVPVSKNYMVQGTGDNMTTLDTGLADHRFYRLNVYDSYTNFVVVASTPKTSSQTQLAQLEMPPMPPGIAAKKTVKPAKATKPVKWHWEKVCPECGRTNKGVDRINGGSNTEQWHNVMFTCKCGYMYSENYSKPIPYSPPMAAVPGPLPTALANKSFPNPNKVVKPIPSPKNK